MRIYNSYILTVASLLLATTVILAALGQNSLEVYYTVYILEALAVTELYIYLGARARRGLNRVSLLLFAGFLLIVAQRVIVGLV
ncbi:MAG: hypothetical protein V3T68_00340 [Dehalococcoidales bacterium]